MTRGSTWNIWDFHLHSPYSVLNNQFGDPNDDSVWEAYVSAIEAKTEALGIAAIGITDYFTIDGYKRLKQYQEAGRMAGVMIFPNVEFRVNKVIYRTKGGKEPKRLNFHVLFSPELPVTLIEDHFLHDLDFTHEDDAFTPADRRRLKTSNLEEFGRNLQEQHEPFLKNSALEIGCRNAVVSLDAIKIQLERDRRFAGKYLLILADEDLSLMDWDGQDHATRKQLMQMSHGILSSNPSTRQYCLGKMHDSVEKYISEFKSFKPCVWGCDSHGLAERFLAPDEERYCWIKAEVTWEGLKQILYEPEERVRVQRDNPESQKSYYTMKSVQVEQTKISDALSIDGLDIELNPNLVAIIGGRGSGKTALLDLIGSCFAEGQKLSGIDSSFYRRLYADQSRRATKPNPIPVSLGFRSGEIFQKAVGKETGVFEQADILYLTQNHMDEYTADPSRLYEHIVGLVFENNSFQRSEYSDLEDQAQALLREIESVNLEIGQLQQEIDTKLPSEQKSLTQSQGQWSDLKQRLAEHESQQAGSGDETRRLTDQLQDLKTWRSQLLTVESHLKTMLSRIGTFYTQYRVDVQEANKQIASLSRPSGLSLLSSELSQLDAAVTLITDNTGSVSNALPKSEEDIAEAEKALGELVGIDQTVAQLRRGINDVETEIAATEQRIKALNAKQARIAKLDSQRKGAYAALMEKTVEQRAYLQRAIDTFETGQHELLTDLSFTAQIDTSKRSEYIERVADKVHLRAHSFDSVSSALTGIIDAADKEFNRVMSPSEFGDQEIFLTIAEQFLNWGADIRLKGTTTRPEFYNALLSPFFRIGLHIEFNGRPLEALSMGERAVVLLKILMGLDDKPLLIDQPEEHLDNRYIYDELTPAFRKAKARRQIIIATHNANLVVNTDAEQILIAEHMDGRICYRVGTLEDLETRNGIKTILEGGDQAFKKREEKYGYRF